uniref:CSON005251 protein n=1 Tax=Culicoides sonorensis TaxID=179676 RepID=A0A336MWN6_CULSO
MVHVEENRCCDQSDEDENKYSRVIPNHRSSLNLFSTKSSIERNLSDKYDKYSDFVAQKITSNLICHVDNYMELETIRKALRKRGFIEANNHPWHSIVPFRTLLEKADQNNEYEKALLSFLVGKYPPDYMFITPTYDYDKYDQVRVLSMLKFNKTDGFNFGQKDGLCHIIDRINWNLDRNVPRINYPRSYDLIDGKELFEFHKDYRLTVATSIVLFMREKGTKCYSPKHGTIKLRVIDFACHGVDTRIKQEEGLISPRTGLDILEIVWGQIYQAYVDLIKNGKKIKIAKEDIPEYVEKIKCLTDEIYHYWPSRKYDGYFNIWLLKPAWTGQGHGIILSDNENDILEKVKRQKTKYVVQKYVECPMLVHDTKFDLRQYFLIMIDDTHLRCFSHWICSVKFASEKYILTDFSERIHITNSCVQQKFRNNKNEIETDLPILWSINQLIEYFGSIGQPTVWDTQIYPVIKSVILSIVEESVSSIDLKPGRFELFGNDWIITSDYKPYLLEVNRCPGLSYFSPVSKIVCGTIMEDLIKGTIE